MRTLQRTLALVLSCGMLAAHAAWSPTRTIKKIEFDHQAGYSRLMLKVDNNFGGTEELYIYKYNCTEGNCYSNNAESAKMVASMAMQAMSMGLTLKVEYNPNFGSGAEIYFHTIEIERN